MTKASKPSVHYEPQATGSDYCGICRHYESGTSRSGTCEIVIGKVNFKGWCEEFSRGSPKTGAKARAAADR